MTATDRDRYWSAVGEVLPGQQSGPNSRGADVQRCASCDRYFRVSDPLRTSAEPGNLAHRPDCWLLRKWNEGVTAGVFLADGSSGGGPGGGDEAAVTFDSSTTSFDSTALTFDATAA